MADTEIKASLGIDTTQADKDVKEFANSFMSSTDKMFKGFSGDKLFKFTVGLNQGLELVEKAALAVQAALDFSMRGEEINAINTRFEILAKQAGAIPDAISSGIADAVKGTVDMEDALQAASKAMISLETGAQGIPQLFDIAKRSAQVFGGDTTQRFEQLTAAIASGSTRSLRDIGLIINAEKVYKEYAASIGTTADQLTQAEKQQALLNATIEKGTQNLKDLPKDIAPLSEGYKRLQVATGELIDSLAIGFNKLTATDQSSFFDRLAKSVNGYAESLNSVFTGKEKSITTQIEEVRNELTALGQMQSLNPNTPQLYSQRISELSTQLALLNQKQVEQSAQNLEAANAQELSNQKIREAAEIERIRLEQKALEEEMAKVELENLRAAQGEWEKIVASKPTMDNFFTGMKSHVNDMSKGMQGLGKQVASTMITGFSSAMGAMGKALVKGEDAMAAFGAGILTMLGQVAAQMGQFYILAGIAALPLNPAQGVAMIAGGMALSLLGGVLQALGGGGGGSGGASVGSPASTAPAAVDNTLFNPTMDEERAKPETSVQVVVQGNLLNTRESALAIVEALNSSFETNGTVIRGYA